MSKPRVEIVTKNGETREFTVNRNGEVNRAHVPFMNANGGHVDKGVVVRTPVSCNENGCLIRK